MCMYMYMYVDLLYWSRGKEKWEYGAIKGGEMERKMETERDYKWRGRGRERARRGQKDGIVRGVEGERGVKRDGDKLEDKRQENGCMGIRCTVIRGKEEERGETRD